MRTQPWKSAIALTAFLAAVMSSGCTSMALSMVVNGGEIVPASYKPVKQLVAYRAEGPVPPKAEYSLVETQKGPFMLERTPEGGFLFQIHWRDEMGDHYAASLKGGGAWEFIVPLDRSKNAVRLDYPHGTYSLVDMDGKKRPVALPSANVVQTLLIPK